MSTINTINLNGTDYSLGASGVGVATEISGLTWTSSYLVNATTGATASSSVFKYCDYIDCSTYSQIIISIPIFTTSNNTQTMAGIAFYNSSKTYLSGVRCELGTNSAQYVILDVPENASYFRTTWYMDSYTSYSNWDLGFHVYYLDENAKTLYDKIFFSNETAAENNGQFNAISTAIQQCSVQWTTTASGMPNASDSATIASGTTVTGLPYSSASTEDGYIGISISLYTFMSAVHNPRSVLYTETSKGYTGYAYYGTVCTTIPSSAWGLPCIVTTRAFPYFDGVTKKSSLYGVELGDMILSNSHAKFITGIIKDAYGKTTYVRASESTYSHCSLDSYVSLSSFVSSHSAYTAYKFNDLVSVHNYEPSGFINLWNETTAEPTFPDIMTNFGDKVTRKYGTDITINVLDSTDYTAITVYKDGSSIQTTSTIADFTLTSPAVGSYEVRMTGTDISSSTYFDIIDNTISLNGTTLSWTNGDSTAIGGYPSYTTDANGKATSWNNPTRVHILTDAEISAKSADISDITVGGGFRIYANGEYGSVSWEYQTA